MNNWAPGPVGESPNAGPSLISGILNINKPPRHTSFDVVARVRRLTRCRRAGHCGTLDPDATGVLLVCLGQATRMCSLLGNSGKTYVAEVELGTATDTHDASGKVTFTGDPRGVDEDRLQQALVHFRGVIHQVPPMYSAIKYHGRPLYDLARSGIEMTPAARTVSVHRLDLLDWAPPMFRIEIECGKGTYVRSIAHDIGMKLGCGAHLKTLVRTQCGPFSLKNAVTLEELEHAVSAGTWNEYLHPADTAILHWSAAILAEEPAKAARCGKALNLHSGPGNCGPEVGPPGTSCRAYDLEGEFIGILDFDAEAGAWHPSRVFEPAGY